MFKEGGSLRIFGVSIYSYWREAGHNGQFIIFILIYITPTCIIFILFWILPAWALIRGISKRQFNMFIPWILSMLLNSSAFLLMAYKQTMFGFGLNYYHISPRFSYLLSSFVILFLLPVQILVWVEAKKCRQEHIQVYWTNIYFIYSWFHPCRREDQMFNELKEPSQQVDDDKKLRIKCARCV